MINKVLPLNSLNYIRDCITQYQSEHDPEVQLKKAKSRIGEILGSTSDDLSDNDLFKTATINEFTNGLLMCDSIYDKFRTFAIEMMRKLQEEYNCQTASEKATCELATMAFIRIFEYRELMIRSEKYQSNLVSGHSCGNNNILYSDINRQHAYFGCNACNRAKIEQQHYQTLGKELDRANRTYLSAIQTLRMMKQAPLQITVKAQTAFVGQNQMVQANYHE